MEEKKIVVNSQLLQRYHLGLCNSAECDAIEQWLNSEAMEEMDSLPNSVSDQKAENLSWRRLSDQLQIDEIPELRGRTQKRFLLRWGSIAACLLLLTAVTLAYFLTTPQNIPHQKNLEFVAHPGQKLRTQLPDGTQVVLNAGTRLRYTEDAKQHIRQVYLSGEAWFDVRKVADRPFRIQTAQTLTQVLGTQFNLNTFHSGGDEIAVESGQVRWTSLKSPKESRLLNANAGAKRQSDGKLVSYTNANASAWKENKLVFKDTPLAEACIILSRWYGVEIRVKNKNLQDMPYTAQFEHPRLNEILQNIAFVLNTSYTIDKQVITIR